MSAERKRASIMDFIRAARAAFRLEPAPAHTRPVAETLEDRKLLSVTGASLTVNGGLGPHYIPEGGGTFSVNLDASTTDGNDVLWDIDWGDGTHTNNLEEPSNSYPTTSHAYNDEEGTSRIVSYQVWELSEGNSPAPDAYDGNSDINTIDPLSITPVSINTDVPIPYNGDVADFTTNDLGASAGDFTATIDWGDGTQSHPDVTTGTIAGGGGSFSVDGQHTYFAAGTFNTKITIDDDGLGGDQVAQGNANVTLPVVTTVTAQDASATSNSVTASGNSAVDLWLAANSSGSAQLNLTCPNGGISPDTPDTRLRSLWTITGDTASSTSGNLGSNQITLTPAGTHEYVIKAGYDANGNGTLDAGEVTRTIDVHVVSAASISLSANGQSQTSTDSGLTITDANSYAVPQAIGSMSVQANAVLPNTASAKSHLAWAVVRNSADVLAGAAPTIKVNPNDHSSGSVSTNSGGSFNLTVYLDKNGNGSYDAGEELRVFHLAIVQISIQHDGQNDEVQVDTNNFTMSVDDSGVVTAGTGSNTQPLIRLTAHLLLQGGGADEMIGVSKMHPGWLQNETGDTFKVDYGSGGGTGTDQLLPGESFPLLDGDIDYQGQGGDGAYMMNPFVYNIKQLQGGGETEDLQAWDAPSQPFFASHTFNGTSLNADSTSGTFSFIAYAACYSSDFNKSFSAFGKYSWSVSLVWEDDQNTDDMWENIGCSTTASSSDLITAINGGTNNFVMSGTVAILGSTMVYQ